MTETLAPSVARRKHDGHTQLPRRTPAIKPVRQHQRAHRRALGLCVVVALVCIAAVSCHKEYDFERQAPERGTFGEEVFRVLRKDAALSPRSHTSRAQLLDQSRPEVVTAIDTLVPEDQLRPLADFLLAVRPLQDNEQMPQLTRKLASMLGDVETSGPIRGLWEEDNIAGRLEQHKDPGTQSALIEHAVSFERLKDTSLMLSTLVLDNDGFDNQGQPDAAEATFMTDAAAVLSSALLRQEISGDPDRLGLQAAGLLMERDPSFQTPNAPTSLWVAQLDHRGVPVVRRGGNGLLHPPYSDVDDDGLADVNAQGQFIDAGGRVIDIAPYGEPNSVGIVNRDPAGRALAPDGQNFLFEYIDLHSTAASYLIQQSAELTRQDVVFDMPEALLALLPPRQPTTDAATGQTYMGYPADQPLTHLLHAGVEVLDAPAGDELLDVGARLLDEHPEVIAELLLALEEFGDLRDTHPEAELAQGNTLVDDLMPILAQIAQRPGLLADLLEALRDPVTQNLDVALIDMLSFRGQEAAPAPGGPYETCFARCERNFDIGTGERVECIRACPNAEILKEPMNLEAPRSAINRSHFERTMALLWDTDGVPFEMLVTRLRAGTIVDVEVGADALPPLLRIDNAAGAFLMAVAGEFRLVDHVTDEAIDSAAVGLMVDGMDFICGTSFFGRLIEALVPTLISVTSTDLSRTCNRFEIISNNDALVGRNRRRHQIAVMVSFLSLLTDVAMDESPTAAQLTRFFNTPNPSVDLELLNLELGELRGKDGYRLWEHHGDMLYGAEAVGLLDALAPVARAFARHDAIDLMTQLSSVIHLHYSAGGLTHRQANGDPSPQAPQSGGIQAYERMLRDWLLAGRVVPALYNLSLASGEVRSRRNRSADAILGEAGAHLLGPAPGLAHFDGRTTSLRADGQPVEVFNRFYVLADALDTISARLDATPQARAKWDRATDAAIDIFIGVEKDPNTGEAVYSNPGSIALTRAVVSQLADLAVKYKDEGTLSAFLRDDLQREAQSILTGQGMPVAIDIFNTVNSNPQDRALLKELLEHSMGDAQGTGNLLVALYSILVELGDEEGFVIAAHFYGELLNPRRTWEDVDASPLPLLSHAMLVTEQSIILDEGDVMLGLIRNGATRHLDLRQPGGDPAGRAPMSVLADTILDYHRAEPTSDAPLSAEDYGYFSAETRTWLLDDRTGMEQVYDMVRERKR